MLAEKVLERELGTYEANREELVRTSLGKFAVVFGDRVLAVCDTYDEALGAGYEQAGVDDPFLIKQVAQADKVCHIYRGSITE